MHLFMVIDLGSNSAVLLLLPALHYSEVWCILFSYCCGTMALAEWVKLSF